VDPVDGREPWVRLRRTVVRFVGLAGLRFGHVTTAQPPWSNQLPRAQPDNALALSSVLAVVKLVERRMPHGRRSIRPVLLA
jgi:histidinol-phosphate/aromatic aminotransferase/cobyric acid decarboxylase-like protein